MTRCWIRPNVVESYTAPCDAAGIGQVRERPLSPARQAARVASGPSDGLLRSYGGPRPLPEDPRRSVADRIATLWRTRARSAFKNTHTSARSAAITPPDV